MKQIFFNLIFNFTESGNNMVQSLFSPFMAGFSVTGFIMQLISMLIDKLAFIFYFAAKFFLTIVDLIFSYVQRLCGLTMDYKSLSGMFSAESDVVFNLLITSKDTVVPIIQNMLGLTIFMIILFTIIALIKAEFNALTSKKPGFIMEVLKKTMRAFVLLMVTPMMALGAIAGSNLLLMTLHRATNSAGGASLGTQIFSASAATANNYRLYAEKSQIIPITFDFSKQKEVLEYYKSRPATDTFSAYLKGSGNLIYTTYTMFQLDDFIAYGTLDSSDEDSEDSPKVMYYKTYDANMNPGKSAYAKYKRIESRAEQYYVMADVVDFAINTGNRLRIMTIEQALDTVVKNIQDETERKSVLEQIVKRYNIRILGSNPDSEEDDLANYTTTNKDTIYKAYTEMGKKGITYTGKYISDQGKYISDFHTHVCGATDEINGAKFIVAVEAYDKNNTLYYEPLSIGYAKNANISFYSDYLLNGSIVTAKGFMNNAYPTALKFDSNNRLVSYREDFVNNVAGDTDKLAGFTIGTAGPKGGFLAGLIAMLQMFFNPEDSIESTIAINPGAVQLSYNSKPLDYTLVQDGKFQLGYFMRYSPSKISKDIAVLTLYRSSEFNILLMFAAPIILTKVMFICFLGLIQRSYELFLIVIFYPAAVVAIPLDDAGYTNWVKVFTNKLFATYGMILGINFVLMLFPIITELEYFTQADIATNKVAFKVCSLFFGGTIRQMTIMLNTVTAILFELVAFTLLDIKPDNGGVPDMINKMAGTDGDLSSDLAENFAAVASAVKKGIKILGEIVKLIGKVIPYTSSQTNSADTIDKTQKAANNTRKIKDFMNKLLPGGKIREKIAEKKALGKDKDKVDKKRKELEEKLKKENTPDEPGKPGEDASEEDKKKYEEDKKAYEEAQKEDAKNIEAQFMEMIAAEREYTESLKDPSTNREAKAEEEIQNKKTGVSEEDYQDDGEGDGEDEGDVNSRDGEGGEGDDDGGDEEYQETDETFKTDKELNSREKELKKNIERLEALDTGELDTKSLTDQEKARKRALKRQKAELARIQKERKYREDNGLDTKKGKDKKARIEEVENERAKLLANENRTEEDEKRLKDLERFMTRLNKDEREKGLEKRHLENEYNKNKEKEEKEKQKQRESERINRDYKDRELFLEKNRFLLFNDKRSGDAIEKRINEATEQGKRAQDEVVKAMKKNGMDDASMNELLEKISKLRLNDEVKYLPNGQRQELKSQDAEFDKLLKEAGITDKKLVEKFEDLRRAKSDMQHLESLVDRRGNAQARWKDQEDEKIREKQMKALGKKGRLGGVIRRAGMSVGMSVRDHSDNSIGKVESQIDAINEQLSQDQDNLVLKNKLNDLIRKRDEMYAARQRNETWQRQQHDLEFREQMQSEYKDYRHLQKAKKKAVKTLKGSNVDFKQGDVDRMVEYFIDKKSAKQRIKGMRKLDKYGQKSLVYKKRDLDSDNAVRARERAVGKANKLHSKTNKAIEELIQRDQGLRDFLTKRDANGNAIKDANGQIVLGSLDEYKDEQIFSHIRNMKKGQYYSAEQMNKINLLEKYMEERKLIPKLDTMGADIFTKREEYRKGEKEYVKQHLKERMKNDDKKYR